MGRYVPVFVAVLLWIDTLAHESRAQCLCPISEEDDRPSSCEDDNTPVCINYTLINFNNERMEVLWGAREHFPEINTTMFYKYYGGEEYQCPRYVTDQGYNTGCIFHAEDADLEISIRDTNGTKELYYDEQNTPIFFKPNPPEDVTFQWADDKLAVDCKPPSASPHCFHFELQYKSRFDKDWRFRKNKCCKLQLQGFHPAKCYSFRFRLMYHCGIYSSEWSNQTFWENGSSVGSCDIKPKSNMVLVLILVMVAILIKLVLLLWVCRLERFRRAIMPTIPDPKNKYSELFSGYHGDFQEWISKTGNVLVPTKLKLAEEEEACVVAEEMEGCLQGVEVEAKGTEDHVLQPKP